MGKIKESVNGLNNIKVFFVILAILVISVFALCFIAIPTYSNAEEVGKKLGEAEGKAAGLAIGSYEGLTEGADAGKEAGRIQGLSAEDTEALLKGEMKKVNKLEVFVADIGLNDVIKVGEGDKQSYAGLYTFSADCVFTVDLTGVKLSIEKDEDGNETVLMEIPLPESELYIDEKATEKKAEWSKSGKAGSAKDGYTGYMNSRDKIEEKALEVIKNNPDITEEAKKAGLSQVATLAGVICGDDAKVAVTYIGDSELKTTISETKKAAEESSKKEESSSSESVTTTDTKETDTTDDKSNDTIADPGTKQGFGNGADANNGTAGGEDMDINDLRKKRKEEADKKAETEKKTKELLENDKGGDQ